MSVQNNQSSSNGMKRNHSNSYVSTPQNGMKKSRSDSNISDTPISPISPISSIKMNLINPNQTIRIEDKRNISDISFEKFSYYCINNNISEDITNEVTLCCARIINLFKFDEFKNLDFDSKRAILIASIMLICKNNKVIECFELDINQQEIINELLKFKQTNELWKFIPRDMFYLSQVGYNAIIKFTKKFNYDYNIKNDMINYFENINKNIVVNPIIKNQYESLLQDNIKLNTFIKSKKEVFNFNIINFFM